ncbi:Tetratricopeptide repeat protein 37 [Desmophyllum pertusum]|uniref:Tetratricopeptide repeat protein 37 n=1 Tax=Desmophyllum pertusum TaxID=174260 RepID=A0A9W9YWA4_9CNID|nr:Tetratricopeptide repeat protein 37 [Desmophyllum pertusum]
MYGILLEHQKLFLQAEKAFESAIKLLQENGTEDQQQHLNTVLVNHTRVLCSLGRYNDAVACYQAVKPLTMFYDVCGLALSLFMAGQLKDSYQAYEQAFQLADTDADRSCVLTAMGMLGYTLNDKEGAKAMLFKSSQLQPACDRGLMALCALGLVSGDATLAGAALGELMKRKNGSEDLTGDICYLYSRFYALQGNQKLGRSHIMKEIHRNPASSLLWSQLASYLLQACPDEQEAAACCSESSARLGGSHSSEHNPAFHPAGIVGSGALRNHISKPNLKSATNRTRSGLIASQKAVHAHPDHVTSWAVLSASVTAHNIATGREGLETEKNGLGARISQFVESAASQEKVKALSEHQLPALVEAQTSHLETLQSWAIIHRGYCLLYSGLHQEAAKHVDQALSVYSSIPQISAQLHFLKAQVLLASGEPVEIGLNLLQNIFAIEPNSFTECLADVQANQGSPMAAELCYRQCLQAGMDSKAQSWRVVPLIRLAMLAVRLAQSESADRDRWINLSLEASNEVLKLKSGFSAAYLIQGIVYYLQDNARASRRAFQHVIDSDTGGSAIAQYWLLLLHLKKNDLPAAMGVLSKAKFDGNSRLDLFYYQVAKNGDLSVTAKKRLIERCIHVNPSEHLFWNSLKEY